MADRSQKQEESSSRTCHFLETIPLEIRLEIYKYLLVLELQPPQYRSGPSPKVVKPLVLISGAPNNINNKNNHSTTTTDSSTPTDTTNDINKNTTTVATSHNQTSPTLLLHPSILSTCRQITYEALPILYKQNTFLAHESNLTISPHLFLPNPIPQTRLRSSHPYFVTPISVPISPSIHSPRPNPNINLIRRWRIRVRLDCGFPPWPSEDVTRAFSGAEELTLVVYRAMFIGAVGVDVLRRFEGVRGVRRVKILGCVRGFEGYVGWLEGVMMSEVGEEEENKGRIVGGGGCEGGNQNDKEKEKDGGGGKREVFMVGGYRCVDELERKRLTGWVC